MQVFARALNVSEQELFAMMERGELLAKDVLPLVGAEFAKAARQGNALATALASARIQQRRFITSAQEGADVIFQAGFGAGTSNLFETMTDSITSNKSALEGLGKTFKLVFDTVAVVVKLVTPVLDSVLTLLGALSDTLQLIAKDSVGKFILAAAAMTGVVKTLTFAVSTLLVKLLAVLGAIDEIYSLFTEGRVGLLELAVGKDLNLSTSDLVNTNLLSPNPILGAATRRFMGESLTSPAGSITSNQNNTEVKVTVDAQVTGQSGSEAASSFVEQLQTEFNDVFMQNSIHGEG